MAEFLMLFPDRDVAEQVADELLEEDDEENGGWLDGNPAQQPTR